MSELAIRVARTSRGALADSVVWAALAHWRESGELPRGFTLRRGNYGRKVGPRAWLRYVARVKETWRPGLVLVDYDSEDVPPIWVIWHRLWKARLRATWLRYDRTPRGWHLVLQLRRSLTLAETVALQAVLGSDPHREAFNLGRAIGLRRRPSTFWASRANVLYGGKLRWGAKQARGKRHKSEWSERRRGARQKRKRQKRKRRLRS